MAQWNKNKQDYLNQERSLFETMMLADHWGEQADWRPSFTSSRRLKTSPYQTTFFNTFQYGKESDVWDESVVGIASVVHDPDSASVTISVGADTGSAVVRQTKSVMRYISGRAASLSFAIRFDVPQVGIRRRIGLFDENNGFYFEDDGGTYSCAIRHTTAGITTDIKVVRDNWSGDKLDGTGWSQYTADPTKIQMVNFDYEWYGAGQVQFNWVIGGEKINIHKFNTANELDRPWSATPFLPIRCELENVTGVAGTHYMYQGSNSLIQEGEPEKLGILVSQSTNVTGRTMAAANTFYPIMSIRMKSDQLTGIVLPRSLQAATNDNTNVFWRLIVNPTLTGANWQNHADPDAFTQYDLSATALTGGRVLMSGFTIAGGASLIEIDDKAQLQLGRSGIGTVSDIYTLACASPNTNKSALTSLNWIEQR
jgi:hypothetical protein